MTCETVIEELVALVDGELDDEERRTIEAHLAGCDGCRAAHEALAASVRAMHEMPATEPAAGYKQRFWQRFDRARSEGFGSRVLSWLRQPRPATILGAGVVATVVALFLFLRPGSQEAQVDRAIASHLDLFTDYDAIRNLDVLEDLEFIEAWNEEV